MKNYSKIATIVYAEYTENVDMLNPLFRQSELDTIAKNDADCIRIDYYINGVLVGNKSVTGAQAIAQIAKLRRTSTALQDAINDDYEGGYDWYKAKARNLTRAKKIKELEFKIDYYTQFVDENSFEKSEITSDFCCTWEDFRHHIYN